VTRRLLNFLTALSLLLCVAALAMWVRSYRHLDYFGRHIVDMERMKWSMWHAMSERGTVAFGYSWTTFDSTRLLEAYAQNYKPVSGWYGGSGSPTAVPDRPSFWQSAGFDWRWTSERPVVVGIGTASLFSYLEFPYWLVASLAALLPTVRLWSIGRARRRVRRGHCPRCGYDLTGNVSGVCPECGDVTR
jgi:hypothetical protein